ncbi:PHP domain-containing protein [Sporolactobacillus nakayamae]|uniref:Histidinol-phosphatase n=1 Tax=Sporolactobacillus nakayamae TaxID=269670 RepID=A0A1I2UCM6_9BACL|nr:PHP domain-containing protein [Sporolactobacillus nakayamae]SFG74945.1 histidinol-phosphatase (PHP family) [Sporolactobacillus nakayamae]
MPFDTHNHTKFSFDAEMGIEEAIKQGKNNHLNLIITDHYDLNELDKNGETIEFPLDNYFQEYAAYRNDHLLIGIELGLDNRTKYIIRNRQIIESHPFDFVIGSVHNIQDYDILNDQSKNFLSKPDFFARYLVYAEHTVNKNPFIDTFAHIDYPCRYLEYSDNVLRYDDFPMLIDNFLTALILHDICLEINLRLIGKQAFYDGLSSIVQRYAELGGKYVTIGGDNHTPDTIGNKYSLGLKIALDAHLTPVYFKNRRRMIDNTVYK